MNPQGLLHMDLNHTRLPIPPPEQNTSALHPCEQAFNINSPYPFASPGFQKNLFFSKKTAFAALVLVISQTIFSAVRRE